MARGDLNALRGMLSASPAGTAGFFSDEVFGFHAQQAAEKSLKAWVSSRGLRYPKTHDIMALLETLDQAGELTADFQGLVDLNSFAVQYRYGPLDGGDEDLDRSSLLREVETLFLRVEGKINPAP